LNGHFAAAAAAVLMMNKSDHWIDIYDSVVLLWVSGQNTSTSHVALISSSRGQVFNALPNVVQLIAFQSMTETFGPPNTRP